MNEPTFVPLSTLLDTGTLPVDDHQLRARMLEALTDLATQPAELRAEHSRHLRDWPTLPADVADRYEGGPKLRRHQLLVADLYDAPDLAALVVDAYGPGFAAELARDVDLRRRPHPLVVTPWRDVPDGGGWWPCSSCGALHTADEVAVVVTGRPGYSERVDPLPFCAECIRMAAEAIGSNR